MYFTLWLYMNSHVLFAAGLATGVAGMLGSIWSGDLAVLFLPAGIFIAMSALLNRGRGSVEAWRGEPSARQVWLIRAGLILIGGAWASLGIRAVAG